MSRVPLIITERNVPDPPTANAFDFELTTESPSIVKSISFYPLSEHPLPVVVPASGGEVTTSPIVTGDIWRNVFNKRNNLTAEDKRDVEFSVRSPDSSRSRKYEKVSRLNITTFSNS